MIEISTTHNLGRAYGHPHGHGEQGRFSLYSDSAEGGRAMQSCSAEAERRPRDCAASFYPPVFAATYTRVCCRSGTQRCLSGAQSLAPPVRPNPSQPGSEQKLVRTHPRLQVRAGEAHQPEQPLRVSSSLKPKAFMSPVPPLFPLPFTKKFA